ncbi:hypothetical protein NDU88_004767 [Pleurodeles waltl]|uniref:Uncharacterized protein n=1 Tax=Pleurodeles waltl TaxID=8319 RepID=A0AAV7M8N3_PLEWA|nr:hypothetical protein NDU88_004767 [Pleurodeles waltl]
MLPKARKREQPELKGERAHERVQGNPLQLLIQTGWCIGNDLLLCLSVQLAWLINKNVDAGNEHVEEAIHFSCQGVLSGGRVLM